MTEQGEPARLLTAEEVAAILGVPISTLYQWRYMGTAPPAAKVGRHLRWRREDLDEWIRERIAASGRSR